MKNTICFEQEKFQELLSSLATKLNTSIQCNNIEISYNNILTDFINKLNEIIIKDNKSLENNTEK